MSGGIGFKDFTNGNTINDLCGDDGSDTNMCGDKIYIEYQEGCGGTWNDSTGALIDLPHQEAEESAPDCACSVNLFCRQLGENIAMKTELAEDVYGSGMDKAMFQTGQSLYGLTRQGMGAAARTGFASSGQVQAQTQRAQEAGVAQFGFQRQSLQDVLGQKLMDISEFEGAERGRLEAEQTRLAAEMQQQRRAASGSGFFQNLMGG